jgi:iron complex outermembrane receptor protein
MKNMQFVSRVALCAAGLAGLASPAYAQSSDGAEQGAVRNDIIVTAQRRAERLEDVPLSITALQGDSLDRAGISNAMELGQLVPGANFTRVGAQVKPSIRGVSTSTSGWTFENNVAIYIDGFYQVDPFSTGNDLSNIKSIQVLKGPQGTLYGRNATGGAIVIETLDPSDEMTAKASLSYGRYNDIKADGYLSLPINDKIAVSVMGYRRVNDGFMRDIGLNPDSKADDFDAAPVKQTALRAKAKFKPTDTIDITLGYSYTYSDVPVGLVFHQFRNFSASTNPLNLPPRRATGRFDASQNVKTKNAVVVRNYTAKVELETGIGTLTSYTGWNRRANTLVYDADGSKLVSFQAIHPWDANTGRTFQQALDFVIDAGDRLDLVIGAFYLNDTVATGQDGYAGNANTPIYKRRAVLSGKSYAGYVDATFEVIDRLFLTAGARYTHEKRNANYIQGWASGLGKFNETFKDLTPHASVRYEIGDRTNIYASYSEGFRSGVFDGAPGSNAARPEKIQSYEIGFKTASSTLRFDTAAYYYDFANLQLSVLQSDPVTGGTTPVLSNAKAAEGYGGEMQVTWSPSEALNVRAGGAYNHAEYTDFSNAIGNGFNATGATSLSNGKNISNQLQDWAGQQLVQAPTWTANIGFDYAVGLAGGELMFVANANYSSSFDSRDPSLWGPLAAPLADPNKQRFRSGSYAMANAQINWTDSSEHLTLGVYCNNCTNTKFVTYSSGGSFGDYRLFNEPVTYGVKIGFQY